MAIRESSSLRFALVLLTVIAVSRAAAVGRVRFQESNRADESHALGLELFKRGSYQQAAECFAKAVQLSPDWAEAHNDLGMSYEKLGRFVEAAESFNHAISISPSYALAYYNLGGAYRDVKRYEESVAAYREALQI
jgi:Flp pilus assembly protein TadD